MPKKILIITDNRPDQVNGVVTTYDNISRLAQADGYDIAMITPEAFPNRPAPGYPDISLAWPRGIGDRIQAHRPDHVHIATEGPVGLAARLVMDRWHWRYNTAYHTRFPEAMKKLLSVPEPLTRAYVRWFHKHAGRVLTTTDTMVQELTSQGFDGDVRSWTRGVDRSVFVPDPHYRDQKILLCVSRVSEEKNLEDFFRLQIPGYRKIMVGDGPARDRYENQYPAVEFVGMRRGQELARYYQQASCFVFPSRWETFGIVMIEAMASGTPVAAYPCAGPRDVIDPDRTGVMNQDLGRAVQVALELDRDMVYQGSLEWTWERAWQIFLDNLVPIV